MTRHKWSLIRILKGRRAQDLTSNWPSRCFQKVKVMITFLSPQPYKTNRYKCHNVFSRILEARHMVGTILTEVRFSWNLICRQIILQLVSQFEKVHVIPVFWSNCEFLRFNAFIPRRKLNWIVRFRFDHKLSKPNLEINIPIIFLKIWINQLIRIESWWSLWAWLVLTFSKIIRQDRSLILSLDDFSELGWSVKFNIGLLWSLWAWRTSRPSSSPSGCSAPAPPGGPRSGGSIFIVMVMVMVMVIVYSSSIHFRRTATMSDLNSIWKYKYKYKSVVYNL